MVNSLKAHWHRVLDRRYAHSSGIAQKVPAAVERLTAIYHEFCSSGLADTSFRSSLAGTDENQRDQRLGEMLLFHYLRRAGFTLSSKDDGPDFFAHKDGHTVNFELVTPSLDPAGTEALKLAIGDPLHPDPSRHREAMQRALLRITSALASKHGEFAKWIDKGKVAENATNVIVINDALLCPDYMFYGITHGANHGESGSPLIMEATVGEGIPHWIPPPTPGPWLEQRVRRSEVVKITGDRQVPIAVEPFYTAPYGIIAAAMQVTLREDYGLALVLEEAIAARYGLVTSLSHRVRGELVLNPRAAVPLLASLLPARCCDTTLPQPAAGAHRSLR